MSVTVKTNRAAWESAVTRAGDRAVEALANQMKNDSLPHIPDDGEHTLRDHSRIEKPRECERVLVWNDVYAGYQWYGMRADGTHVVRHYTTSGTGKMWVEQARAENADKWQKTAQNAFTEGLK